MNTTHTINKINRLQVWNLDFGHGDIFHFPQHFFFIGDSRFSDGSPHKGPVIRIYNVLFAISVNKLLNKQPKCWRFEASWRSCDAITMVDYDKTLRPRLFQRTCSNAQTECHMEVRVNSALYSAGLILGLRPANERRRYLVTTSLIGWTQT